ncbi:SDR family NAD(P)-dependent oxidoreductase [Mycolicibacterium madagascariense]|nr:SDR family NAD(P)-dependent oxidoreductase [Mycolicibacterium madagascariense]MCV7013770.1 SDR family NAD(P)-dependent oxidoreductase [Mycolicibacterium madagascariense]
MNHGTASSAGNVVIVLDGDTEAGQSLARRLLAEGRRVAVVVRHAADGVAVLHGQSYDRVMVIAADADDRAQWSRVTERVRDRFGRIDTVVRAQDAALRLPA